MIGLITRREDEAARSSADADQSTHSASSVITSRTTVLSTSTPVMNQRLAARERENFVGGQAGGRRPAHPRNQILPPPLPGGLANADAVADDVEFDFGIGQQFQPLTNGQRDGGLPF